MSELTFRCLKLEELPEWFALCGDCFASKGTPSYYFQKHWECDPDAQIAGVFVAVDEAKLVASVRVFHRTISVGGKHAFIGGIGEVGTRPEYRQRGISSKLLQMALDYVNASNMVYSVLHAAPEFVPFYEKFGWQSLKAAYVVLQVPTDSTPSQRLATTKWVISDATEQELEFAMELHQKQLASGKFDGLMVRNSGTRYWKEWISFRHQYKGVKCLWIEFDGKKVGYVFARLCSTLEQQSSSPQTCVHVEEVVYDLDALSAFSVELMLIIVRGFGEQFGGEIESGDVADKIVSVRLPEPIARDLGLMDQTNWEYTTEIDCGWMYAQTITSDCSAIDVLRHVIFATDSF